MKTLNELALALEQGKTTSQALVEEALTKAADPAGEGKRAFLTLDADGARASAAEMDRLRKAGRAPSRFAGIPFSVKDLFDLAGEVTRAGSVVLKDSAPAQSDAPAIARLKAKGFIVLGRTNMTEFAYSGVGLNPHYGTPLSPYDRKTGRIPGGSSSGAAVSVADEICALGIGSDTGGSCRIPASYCGITGYKPSAGKVPKTGAFPLSQSFDSVGPLANSVACCATAHAIMADEAEMSLVPRPVDGLRLGVLRDYVLEGLDPEVASAFEAALSKLAKAGASVVDARFPELVELPSLLRKGGIVAAEAYHVHRYRMAEQGALYDPRVFTRIQTAEAISAADYLDYFQHRTRMTGRFHQLFQGLDALVLPTTMNVPPPVSYLAKTEDYLRYNAMSLRNTYVANFLNGCSLSLPMTVAGEAPAGFMLIAPNGWDSALFSTSAGVEQVVRRT